MTYAYSPLSNGFQGNACVITTSVHVNKGIDLYMYTLEVKRFWRIVGSPRVFFFPLRY